ncbi:hypothetical protein ABZ942_42110 [Nocardia sp. NPDC046473]|uniref:SMP-30/gluconolactonase/LRE family protein n=1 Tax=Nocardia sp. NPDC046473 TaxID=3155733 RepID=UPI0033EB2ACB
MRLTGMGFGAAGMVAAVLAGTMSSASAQPVGVTGCAGWQTDTLASGLGQLENLETDGNGGFYVSGADAHKLYDVDASGNVTVALDATGGPLGLQRDGSTLYFMGRADSGAGVQALDTTTGAVTHITDMGGNGLLRLPNGDLLTTWVGTEGGPSAGVTRYDHDTGAVQPNWGPVPRGEGLALSPDHAAVYTDDLFTGQVYRIPLNDPAHWTVVGRVDGLLPGDDDLTAAADGSLYVAAHIGGSIVRMDPATGATCAIATSISPGWNGPASVRIGPDGEGWALYVSAFDGTLRRIRPPADVDLAPVQTS